MFFLNKIRDSLIALNKDSVTLHKNSNVITVIPKAEDTGCETINTVLDSSSQLQVLKGHTYYFIHKSKLHAKHHLPHLKTNQDTIHGKSKKQG